MAVSIWVRGILCGVLAVLGTESNVVLNHVPLAGGEAANVANLNDADDNTCVTLPNTDEAPWQFKVQMDTVQSDQLVKIVPDGMPCDYSDLIVMVNTTDATTPPTNYMKCDLVHIHTSGAKDVCDFNCGTDTTDKYTFMQIFKPQTGWQVCGVSYETEAE